MSDSSSIVSLESMSVKESLIYEDVTIDILYQQVEKLRNNEVASVNVFWKDKEVESATQAAGADMVDCYPYHFIMFKPKSFSFL